MKANIHLKSLLALVRRLRQKQDSRPTVPRMRLKIEQKNQTHRCFGGANSIPPSLGLQQLALYVHIYCSLDGGLCWPSKRCWSKSKKDQDSKRCLNSSNHLKQPTHFGGQNNLPSGPTICWPFWVVILCTY